MSEDTEMPECTICLCSIEKTEKIYKNNCNHIFHKDCIEKWLINSGSCPNCKAQIPVNKIIFPNYRGYNKNRCDWESEVSNRDINTRDTISMLTSERYGIDIDQYNLITNFLDTIHRNRIDRSRDQIDTNMISMPAFGTYTVDVSSDNQYIIICNRFEKIEIKNNHDDGNGYLIIKFRPLNNSRETLILTPERLARIKQFILKYEHQRVTKILHDYMISCGYSYSRSVNESNSISYTIVQDSLRNNFLRDELGNLKFVSCNLSNSKRSIYENRPRQFFLGNEINEQDVTNQMMRVLVFIESLNQMFMNDRERGYSSSTIESMINKLRDVVNNNGTGDTDLLSVSALLLLREVAKDETDPDVFQIALQSFINTFDQLGTLNVDHSSTVQIPATNQIDQSTIFPRAFLSEQLPINQEADTRSLTSNTRTVMNADDVVNVTRSGLAAMTRARGLITPLQQGSTIPLPFSVPNTRPIQGGQSPGLSAYNPQRSGNQSGISSQTNNRLRSSGNIGNRNIEAFLQETNRTLSSLEPAVMERLGMNNIPSNPSNFMLQSLMVAPPVIRTVPPVNFSSTQNYIPITLDNIESVNTTNGRILQMDPQQLAFTGTSSNNHMTSINPDSRRHGIGSYARFSYSQNTRPVESFDRSIPVPNFSSSAFPSNQNSQSQFDDRIQININDNTDTEIYNENTVDL